ncbi:DUF6126 family protein [Streptomyces sp. NPDC059982]|uniref:DUF6126 family protein n=1 Tax=unclassified Streptomyces TaxID=2593676 RepID=UPI0036CFDC6F
MTQGEHMPSTTEQPAVAETDISAGTETETATAADTDTGTRPAGLLGRVESRFPRGLVIRLVAYLFVGHLFAFFVYLLFVLGGQNQ